MKKFTVLILLFALVLSLAACGAAAESTIRAVNIKSDGITGILYIVEGPAPNNKSKDDYEPLDEPVILLDNETLKAEIAGFFEQEYGAKDDRKLGRGASVLFTNHSSEDLLVSIFKGFIDTKPVQITNLGCPSVCPSGETIQIDLIFNYNQDSVQKPIDSYKDIYLLRGSVNTYTFIDEETVSPYAQFDFSLAESDDSEAENSAARVKREFEAIEVAESEDLVYKFEEPILLLDNEYLKLEIVEFFQQNVNWADEKGPRMERGITFKTSNKHNKELLVDLQDLYIGDKEIKLVFTDGSISPEPGRAQFNGFYVWNHSGHDDLALDDINELFNLEGNISVSEYVEENRISNIGTYSFYVS